MMAISVQIAIFGFEIQSTPLMPIFPSKSLSAPWVCRINDQPVPTMTSEIT